ncbi:hypothetical protein FOL47_005004 [Perkinsus chesapeaki]|uniref:Uncharacterized protein n=1 Tax=Perkinsus chesapeaki TaxID=330153 RepID=A0A7J6LZI7_PERCH|nr:hypothetical protein FOL47_005004 [Perkinsus chesapeaki]
MSHFIYTILGYFGYLILCVAGFPPTPNGNYALNIDEDTCVQVHCIGDFTTLKAQLWVQCDSAVMPSTTLEMEETELNSFVVDPESEQAYNTYIRAIKTTCAPDLTVGDNDMKRFVSRNNNEQLYVTFAGSERILVFNKTCWD